MVHSSPDGSSEHRRTLLRAEDIVGVPLDRRRNPLFGFVRLANLSVMSPELTEAYELRVHPDAPHLLPTLAKRIRRLDPEDLGRFAVLNRANDFQGIFTRAVISGYHTMGLAVLAQYDGFPHGDIPSEEWCDAAGTPLRVIREHTAEYEAARDYEVSAETLLSAAIDLVMTSDEEEDGTAGMDAFGSAWREAGQELVESHRALHEAMRAAGPLYLPDEA